MTGARIEIPGEGAALAALAAIVDRLDHPYPMYDDIGASLVTSTQRRFEEGRGPDGSPWPKSVRAKMTGGKTLIESARLMNSQTHNASDAGVEVGTNVVYAAIHQLGGVIDQAARQHTIYRRYDERTDELSDLFVKKSKANYAEDVTIPARKINMPARPFLGIDENDEREILRIAADHVAGPEARP